MEDSFIPDVVDGDQTDSAVENRRRGHRGREVDDARGRWGTMENDAGRKAEETQKKTNDAR